MSQTSFKIIRNAPPPPARETRGQKGNRRNPREPNRTYPFGELAVGDAFDVPILSVAHDNMRYPEYNRVAALVSQRNKLPSGPRFVVRMMPDAFVVRCWRVS